MNFSRSGHISIINILKALFAIVFVTAAAGCSNGDEPEAPDEKESGTKLCFNISVDGTALSRAASEGSDEEKQVLDFENMLEAYSKRFLIYQGSQAAPEKAKLIFDSQKNTKYDLFGSTIGGYRLVIDVDNLFPAGSKPDPNEDIDLTLVCISIQWWKMPSSSSNYICLTEWDEKQSGTWSTLDKVIESKLKYCMSNNWYPGTSGTSSKMPLFGMETHRIKAGMLYNSNYPIIDLEKTVWLLRPIVKIFIIDALPKDDGSQYPKIDLSSVSTTSNFQRYGYMIPNNFKNGEQVTSATTPKFIESEDSLGLTLMQTNPSDYVLVQPEAGGAYIRCPYSFFYCSEQILMHPGEIADQKKIRKFVIRIEKSEGNFETFDLNLDGGSLAAAFNYSLLRNHLYKIAVTGYTPKTRSRSDEESSGSITVKAEAVSAFAQ